jgi:toxin CcdB
MAQFDVHRNSGQHRETIPFVVIVQSSRFDAYGRRVVVPLVRKSSVAPLGLATFNPTFRIKGTSVILHPLEIVSISTKQLGDFVESLSNEGPRIVAALDELLSQAWN